MIQVGAYKNSTQAKDHLEQVAGDFGRIVGSALAKVEKAGGNYRVRFRGLNEKQAKAACQALSARGQPCMVMDAS
jgi:D-alanyl-D-alanine carboxypeptidase (penicillin-binding protein 5/6)